MSGGLQFSEWTPTGGESSNPRKRVGMLRKPHTTAPPQAAGPTMDANDQELSSPPTVETSAASQKNIQALLDQMNVENFEENLGGVPIEPIEPPALIQKRDLIDPIIPPQATQLSSYRSAYVPTSLSWTPPQPSQQPGTNSGTSNDRLLEKMNYIIHLLEQQEKEKTDNILEEFILYCFLGVFVIYVVDSFACGGNSRPRYTR